jgi:seryl-tRNA synthetase
MGRHDQGPAREIHRQDSHDSEVVRAARGQPICSRYCYPEIVAETEEVQMTLDERLERLTERHEALTQTVELIVAENRHAAEELAAENKQLAAENKQRDRRLGEIMEGIASLLHVAEIHEQRLDRHDDRLDNLH